MRPMARFFIARGGQELGRKEEGARDRAAEGAREPAWEGTTEEARELMPGSSSIEEKKCQYKCHINSAVEERGY